MIISSEFITALTLASITLVWYVRREAKESKKNAEEIINEKQKFVDKAFSIISMSVTKRLYDSILKAFKIWTTENTTLKDITKTIEELSKKYPQKIDELINLTDEENENFMRAAYLRVYLNSFPYEYSEIISSTSRALVYGFAFSILFYLLLKSLELPFNFVFNNMSKGDIVMILFMLTFIIGIYYVKDGLAQLFKLNKLNEKLDEINESYDFESLEDVFS